jgi:hypothetical protein
MTAPPSKAVYGESCYCPGAGGGLPKTRPGRCLNEKYSHKLQREKDGNSRKRFNKIMIR